MNKVTKFFTVVLLTCGVCLLAFADRGGLVKKNKTRLNIETKGDLRNSINFNLKSGIVYRGSNILSSTQVGSTVVNDAVISYKKGNTTYILPYKQKVFIPQYSQQAGYKLLIRRKN